MKQMIKSLEEDVDFQHKMKGHCDIAYVYLLDLAKEVQRLQQELDAVQGVDLVTLSSRIDDLEMGS